MDTTSPKINDKQDENYPKAGIATDCAHSAKLGLIRFRGIDLKTGEQIFLEEIGNCTVNIGEFLGVVAAVKYIMENNYLPGIIYTDSITAITWFEDKKTASKKKYPALKKAEIFLKAMSEEVDKIKIRHWDNARLGEIPADFGVRL
ncbi:MAG: ribonuclease H [Prevotella sp.]|jgi:ribonuclease HI|nr:ribonuclease H [Prevotella sp.]